MKNKVFSFFKKHICETIFVILISISTVIAVKTSNNIYKDDENAFVIPEEDVMSIVSSTNGTKTETTTANKTTTTTETKAAEFPIDVNKVTFDELMQINGVGSVTANNIINYRQSVLKITNMEQLLNINGIGESTLEMLKNYLYVSDADFVQITTTYTTIITTITTPMNTTQTTQKPELKPVNINTASAEEIAECLLLDIEVANEIVEFREIYSPFVRDLELLYIEGMTKEMLLERRPYIII